MYQSLYFYWNTISTEILFLLSILWMFPISKKEFLFLSRLLTSSYFYSVAQWSLCCPFFPNLSFTLGVLSVSLRFSSWATSLKSLPVITTVTVIHILFISWLLQHLFWPPFFPLSSKSYLLQFLSSLFTIYVNSVPLSDVCFQFPSLLSCNPLCSPCCPSTIIQKICPFPEEVLYYYQDILEQKKQEWMYGGTCFLTQLLATSAWFSLKRVLLYTSAARMCSLACLD